MASIKPFKSIRPSEQMAEEIAALPYDVYNRAEAKEVVAKNPKSFLAIDRAETQFPDDVDTYDERVYQKASEMLREWIDRGDFIKDSKDCYYIYELTMKGRVQTGIVACASIDDYVNGVIKKHENTRADKEQDRINHVNACSAQTGPIFLAYRAQEAINNVVYENKKKTPVYAFVSEDDIRHRVFVIDSDNDIDVIRDAFSKMNEIYIADGHHRAASAVKVGLMRREANPTYTGAEEFNYFLSVLFPDQELMIMDYNRVVKDLAGMTSEEFLGKINSIFELDQTVKEKGNYIVPAEKGVFSMYLDGKWYSCRMKEEDVPKDPVDGLDVSVLQNLLLDPVLGIKDPKTDSRIDFVGGIRGLAELERRCENDCAVAFAMYPTSIAELFDVADAGRLMPPKSTWFEPKLRSGIFIHEF